jgi:hypothetical protein
MGLENREDFNSMVDMNDEDLEFYDELDGSLHN